MPSRRVERVAALLKGQVARIITQELRDPALGFVTLTEVRPASDLRTARVYVSVIGDAAAQERALRVLRRARKYIQARTAARVALRTLPVLSFHLDDRIKQSLHIASLLKRVSEEGHGDTDERRPASG